MGYYDQDYEQAQGKQKGNRGGWFLSALVGAILGALLVVIAIPTLVNLDVLPYDIAINEEQTEQLETNNGTPTNEGINKNVAVNVSSQVTDAVDKVSDAVVGVVNIQQAGFWSNNEAGAQEAGTGSGVIYKKDNGKAYVITNHHVIEGANAVEVSLADGTRVPATILGSDIWTDLAVLEIDGEHVTTVAEFGDSDQINLGEPVIAIGNPLGLEFSGSVTQGIVSGLNRSVPMDINGDGTYDWNSEVLQTDAAINPGNSGGALVNIDGQVIGINSMKIAEQAVEGIGFSIPSNYALPVIEDLEQYKEVRRPYMGVGDLVSLNEISDYHKNQTLHLPEDVTEGVVIQRVEPNSPASQAGLTELDVIVAMDGVQITDTIELRKYLYNEKAIGDTMEVTIFRDGEEQTVTMKLIEEIF
ncbi:S1C family serine protease [Cytobacillus sp. IB215665]|uniref:S1C family serine protease n=1 Tax=Cytobacillus sp. IB215665 TaxID=3097357 RepID=UPI002A15C004|nr:S1C family serine protease [Cytobacillus sp. IB215665]MDX8363570.1 S1C family serine protease [Cytobacillus sp. IB215665]